MNVDNKNKDNLEEETSELFSRLRIPWKQSKEEIWLNVSIRMQSPKIIRMQPKISYWQMAIAAVFVISISLTIFMRSYTLNFNSQSNQLASTELPDGSVIFLNSNSDISYHPYWWWAKRSITLDGEAFFQVQKGNAFIVKSELGTTEVLGTTFNILARGQLYEVTCITGKVKVQATITKHNVIIHPSQKASLQETGELEIQVDVNTENTKAWMTQKLIFTSMPLIEVFKEIEHQYQVEITAPDELTQQYTGSFDKPDSVEALLQMICRPFDLKVEKVSNHQFRVLK